LEVRDWIAEEPDVADVVDRESLDHPSASKSPFDYLAELYTIDYTALTWHK
jgi:hypothetical protein